MSNVTPHPAASEEDKTPLSRKVAGALRGARSIRNKRVTSSVVGADPTTVGVGSASSQVKSLFGQYEGLAYQLPWEILDFIELLATYNPDYSQAVENIKMLANSGHELMVDASTDLRKRRAKDYLELKSRTIQESHGGIDGIIDKLLDQAAVFGAMCGEWVLNDELTEIIDFVDINPKHIRFFWDEDEQRYTPWQKVTNMQAKKAKEDGQETRGNHVRLNEITFRYFAFDAAPGSPYGTPPFLAALTNIAIQRDMVHNMAQIVKKIGLLGMIDVTIERLSPLPGESDSQYEARASEYLDAYAEVAEEMARDGGMVHFDDVKTTMMQLGGNAAGATNIHKANEEMVFSGLKSMPSVQGRSYSTTETYAGVAYDIIIRNTRKYQRAAKRMIESGYWLMVEMQGIQPDKISLSFNENRSLNRAQEATAERTEIGNAFNKWLMGIIDQHGAAQELGYNEPKTPMDLPPESLISILSARGIEDVPELDDFANQSNQRSTVEGSDDDDGTSEDE